MIQNIQFPTELKPIQVAGGRRIPDRQAVVRQDTGEVLGIVGPNYQMIRHIDVVDQFQRIDKLELKEVHSCRRGAIMFAKFDFKGNGTVKKEDIDVGDAVTFGLRAFNSMNEMI